LDKIIRDTPHYPYTISALLQTTGVKKNTYFYQCTGVLIKRPRNRAKGIRTPLDVDVGTTAAGPEFQIDRVTEYQRRPYNRHRTTRNPTLKSPI
jgi:hypothetical protein